MKKYIPIKFEYSGTYNWITALEYAEIACFAHDSVYKALEAFDNDPRLELLIKRDGKNVFINYQYLIEAEKAYKHVFKSLEEAYYNGIDYKKIAMAVNKTYHNVYVFFYSTLFKNNENANLLRYLKISSLAVDLYKAVSEDGKIHQDASA